MKSQKWREKLADKTLALADFESALDEWDVQINKLEDDNQVDKDRIEDLQLQLEKQSAGSWGTCRRGCPPAYLNAGGYCSPACQLGSPRGEFITLATKADIARKEDPSYYA